jgi:hypothetical protein
MEFKRENRYIVIKIADLTDKTGLPMQPSIEAWMKQAQEVRESAGKPHLECLVIESDWPEYEPAWKMIQDRVEGNKSNFDDWHDNPYTKVLMDSIKNDYVPRQQLAKPAVEWISVKDRLPDDYFEKLCYITANNGEKYIKSSHLNPARTGFYVEYSRDGTRPIEEVTHWQPLPNPPADYDALQDK